MAVSFTPTTPNKNATRDTALTLYTGEVIKAFTRKNVALNTVSTRTINGGKSAQWIVTGQAADTDVTAHTPGADIATKVLANDEVIITVDTRYYYSHFLDDLDMKLAQYDIRSELAKQAGEALATKIDKEVFQGVYNMRTIVDAGTGLKPGQQPASIIKATGYDAATTAEARGNALIEAMFAGVTALNEKDVTAEPIMVTQPANYYNLVQSTRGTNQDFTNNNGGIDSGNISQIAGIMTTWTNHLPVITGTGNFTLHGMMYTKDVYGVVKAMDITTESSRETSKLGDLLVSYYALGHGPLNPTGLVQIENDVALA